MDGLRVLLIGGPMYEPLYGRIGAFEERSGRRVERVVARDHPDLNRRIEREFASGEADYDLICTHIKYAPGQRRWLTPLSDFDDLDAGHLAGFSPEILDLATLDGKLYSVPRNLDVKLLHYRTDLVDEPPEGWEELLEVAAALKEDGRAGFVFPGRESGLFGHFFELHAMYGGEMFQGEGPPEPRLADEAGEEALGLLVALYRKAAPPETPEWHYDEVAECFRSGGAAMSTDWPGGFHLYREKGSAVRETLGLALYPEGPAGRSVYAGCHSFAVPETVHDREAALELLKFLTSKESQLFEARFGTLPARTDALEEARRATTVGTLEEERWRLLEEARGGAITPPRHERYPAVEEEIWRGVREAVIGNKSVKEALGDTESAARRAAREE